MHPDARIAAIFGATSLGSVSGALAPLRALRQLAGSSSSIRLLGFFARKPQGVVKAETNGRLFDEQKHELAVYITNLDPAEYNAWQVQVLYRERADAENVFDELKKQWGFSGFCSRKRRVSALAARLLLLVYNLWNLFLRLLEPERHVEAAGGRHWFLVIAARLMQSGGCCSASIRAFLEYFQPWRVRWRMSPGRGIRWWPC